MKKTFPALVFAAVSLLAFSCIKEKETDVNLPAATDQAEVVLRLKTPSGFSAPASRSLSYADENTIGDIYVLVFDKANTLVAIKQGENVTSSAGHTNPSYSGEGSFAVTLEPSKTEADTYNLVVLANAQGIIDNTIGFDVSTISNKSYSSVMSALYGSITGPMYPSGGTIPMWGESGALVVAPGNNSQTLQLTRSVARIDVGVGKAAKDNSTDVWSWDGKDASNTEIPFKLANVYVIKPNNRYAVVPDASKASGVPTVPAGTTAFSYSVSETNFGFAATASATGGHTSRDIYVPEADVKMTASGAIGDANHTGRMAVVVGGYYDGSQAETFYRLDFAVGGSLVNVLRNHLYQFNISKVSGPGYIDVETAYNSLSMNMAVDIYEWDENDMGEIIFDGQNYLSVSPGEFSFMRDEIKTEQDDNVLYVKTDVTGGWFVEKIVDASNGTKGVTWVTPTPDNGAANYKTEVVLTVTENDTPQERSAIIWIAAGRLRYPVTVTQSLTPALGLEITDGTNRITELVFASGIGNTITAQTLKVDWQPRTADLTVTSAGVGINAFPSGGGAPATGTILAGNGGTGTKTYTITPMAFAPADVDEAQGGDPFLEKVSRVNFTTTNGISNASGSIFLRQINYALAAANIEDSYMLDGSTYTFRVRSNTAWCIKSITETVQGNSARTMFDLQASDNLKVGTTGGYNTAAGDVISFRVKDDASISGTVDIVFGSVDEVFADQTVTLTFVNSIAFRFARSNIVWDATNSRLTFAVTEDDNDKYPADAQGVFFQWGSLVAISPAARSGSVTGYTAGQYPAGHILYSPTGTYNYVWTGIPYIGETDGKFGTHTTVEDDFEGYDGNTNISGKGFDAANGKGDICRYISDQGWVDGNWRLPTQAEYDELINEKTSISNGGGFTNITVTPAGGTNAYGYYRHASGRWLGRTATDDDNPAKPTSGGVYFPASGYRNYTNGTANYAGNYGYFRSGSSHTSTTGYYLNVGSSNATSASADRQLALPVRCIRE